MNEDSRLNIILMKTMEKLRLIIIESSPYMINIATQSQDTPLEQISGCRVMMDGEEYFLSFHIIYIHLSKNSYPLLLKRS